MRSASSEYHLIDMTSLVRAACPFARECDHESCLPDSDGFGMLNCVGEGTLDDIGTRPFQKESLSEAKLI